MADRFEADLRAAVERMASDESKRPYHEEALPTLQAAFKEVFEMHLQKYGGVTVNAQMEPEPIRCINVVGWIEVPEGEFPPWLDAGLEEEP
jgi:hypothetical protein